LRARATEKGEGRGGPKGKRGGGKGGVFRFLDLFPGGDRQKRPASKDLELWARKKKRTGKKKRGRTRVVLDQADAKEGGEKFTEIEGVVSKEGKERVLLPQSQ